MTRKTGNATKQVDINLSIILIGVVKMGILVPHIYSFLGEGLHLIWTATLKGSVKSCDGI